MLNTTIVVGIGASAGGLEALQAFIKNLPENDTLAYIIAQHLSPTYKSMMMESLSKISPLEMVEATDGLVIEAKKIYLTPPNKHIFVSGDTITLKTPPDGYVGPKPSVDLFFASLAHSKRHDAVGVILSGTGTDGSKGCAKIKAEGGITIAQDPKDAKYDGMPTSAIRAGQIDIVLPASKIGAELGQIEKYISGEIGLGGHIAVQQKDNLGQIFGMLKDAHGTDFSNYKLTTLNRRIKRRMAALKISKIDDYVELLRKEPGELDTLHKDFFIGVTAFFRDKDAFEELRLQLAKTLAAKEGSEGLKIWDVACCTGEEAYSLAIIIAELLEKESIAREVHIFATDIDIEAVRLARMGAYSAADVSEIPSALIEKYFTLKNESYKVNKNIRDMIIFSCHDVVRDPPFTKLDMIVCRNVLIYFNSSLQGRLLPMFHYALKNNGLLFLGMSESVGTLNNLFTPLTKNSKLYRREFSMSATFQKTLKAYHPSVNAIEQIPIDIPARKKSLSDSLLESLGEYFLPLSILVNEGMDIVFIKERNPYILYSGVVTTNVFKSVHESLSLELRTLIHECAKEEKAQVGMFRRVELFEGVVKLVRIIVMPLRHNHEESKLFVVSFQEESAQSLSGAIDTEISTDNKEAIGLRAELAHTKIHLQTVIEELDNSNEELQSLNEEMQSANEELKSTNEELETTNEELQGTNEELQTAYSELQAIADEMEEKQKKVETLNEELMVITDKARANEALAQRGKLYAEELIEASNALIVILDKKGKIVSFNKQLEDVTGYSKAEAIGQNWFSMFVPQSQTKEMYKAFKQMSLAKEKAITKYENPIVLKNGSERVIAWQDSIHINPDGAMNILAFGVDITARNLIEQHIKLQDDYLHRIINSQNTISFITDGADLVDANKAFFLFFDNFNTVEEFNNNHKCICEYFEKIDKPRFVYDGKDGRAWLDIVADEDVHQTLIVKEGVEHYFVLRLAEFGNVLDRLKIVSMTDITEIENYRLDLEEKMADEVKRSKMQEQLMIQQGKMAAMGEMLGAIAHQWRQPLNTLGIIVQDMGEAYNFDLINKEYIVKFRDSSMRLIQYMSKTIDDFRCFFKPSAENELFFASEALNDSFEILGALLEHNQIKVEQTVAEDDCDKLFCNKNQLKQVFLNIISNAKDAILDNIEREVIENGVIQTKILCQDSSVCISIWNNGSCIPSDVLKRVFEPYFTTKDCGRGAGIGLYMSKIVVEQHLKGKIDIHNRDGGVEAIVEIPINGHSNGASSHVYCAKA